MKQRYFHHPSSLLLTLAMVATAMPMLAVKARPDLQPLSMPDGSVILARLAGDEHAHIILSEEGYPIDRRADGLFYYYTKDATGMAVLSDQTVSAPDARSSMEKEFIAKLDKENTARVC